MKRYIIHSDLNSCYASIELARRPQLRDKPVAVGGSEESRHGIVLARNLVAKKYGVTTGNSLMEARRACPDLVTLPPNYNLYLQESQHARSIYSEYSDFTEAFGIDESWADISMLASSDHQAKLIADEIRRKIKREMGVTVSIGVSFNKIYAKLGSDYRKPDAITQITRENFKEIVFPLPAADLLYVGRQTAKKLNSNIIRTIGDIVEAGPERMRSVLNSKVGEMLWVFAAGMDTTPVAQVGDEGAIKSVGNSNTFSRDLVNNEDIYGAFWMLGESVASRLREGGFEAQTVEIYARGNDLASISRQQKLERPTCLASELVPAAMTLFRMRYDWSRPIRSLGIRGANLIPAGSIGQTSLFVSEELRLKRERKEQAIDYLRERFGYLSVQRAILMSSDINHDAKSDNTIHPISYIYG